MSARDLINRRVVAFVEELKITGKVVQVLKSEEDGFWCELNTDIRITTKLRILELPIRNRRKSNPENSFWVSAIQCMPEDGNYFPNNTSANEHAQQNNQHTIQTSKSAKFKLGDKIYAITDETNESGILNGTVGYVGSITDQALVELCANPLNVSAAEINKLRSYEPRNFPDSRRLCNERSFSLIFNEERVHHLTEELGLNNNQERQRSNTDLSRSIGNLIHPHSEQHYHGNLNSYHSQPNDSNPTRPDSYHIGPDNNNNNISNLTSQMHDISIGDSLDALFLSQQDQSPFDLQQGERIIIFSNRYGYFSGVLKFSGEINGNLLSGAELDNQPPFDHHHWMTPNGYYGDNKLFNCQDNCGVLVPINNIRKDTRYSANNFTISPKIVDNTTIKGHANRFSNHDILITHPDQFVQPMPNINGIVGTFRGIQGHLNSCYMDATLFGMFAFNNAFDPLFLRKIEDNLDSAESILKMRIVCPLRQAKFVRCDQVMMLREALEKAGVIGGLTSKEKDPEEFLKVLLQHVLRAYPYIHLRNLDTLQIENEYIYQIFSFKKEDVALPTVQFLLEHSFKEHHILLESIPHLLILQMPRFGKDYKLYPRIFPSLKLNLSNLTSSTYDPKCIFCKKDANFRCPSCEDDKIYFYTNVFVYYCERCCSIAHEQRTSHQFYKLNVQKSHSRAPIAEMELFAVICIETSHYVCFAKCNNEWVLFDSMANREVYQTGERNIPEVSRLDDLNAWLDDPIRLKNWMASDRIKMNKIPESVDRITKDNYLCFYYSDQSGMF